MSDQEMPETFPKKWLKILEGMSDFKESADAAGVEDLKKIILTSEGNMFTINKAKDEDEKLNAAKEIIKDLSAPYKESLACQNCKIQYALFLLQGMGEDIGSSND
jgi:hypothetical protein